MLQVKVWCPTQEGRWVWQPPPPSRGWGSSPWWPRWGPCRYSSRPLAPLSPRLMVRLNKARMSYSCERLILKGFNVYPVRTLRLEMSPTLLINSVKRIELLDLGKLCSYRSPNWFNLTGSNPTIMFLIGVFRLPLYRSHQYNLCQIINHLAFCWAQIQSNLWKTLRTFFRFWNSFCRSIRYR